MLSYYLRSVDYWHTNGWVLSCRIYLVRGDGVSGEFVMVYLAGSG